MLAVLVWYLHSQRHQSQEHDAGMMTVNAEAKCKGERLLTELVYCVLNCVTSTDQNRPLLDTG